MPRCRPEMRRLLIDVALSLRTRLFEISAHASLALRVRVPRSASAASRALRHQRRMPAARCSFDSEIRV